MLHKNSAMRMKGLLFMKEASLAILLSINFTIQFINSNASTYFHYSQKYIGTVCEFEVITIIVCSF